MTTLLGIAGSLRRGSYNAALLRAAIALAPEGVTIEEGSMRGIPLYDGDLEAEQGIPESVQQLKERIVAADGLMIVTPEYNNSIPGVLKNTIDWLSRPGSDIARVFGDRPIAILGASPGRFGTAMAQAAWLPVLRALGARAWFGPRMLVGGAAQVFDAEGKLVDERVRGELTKFVAGFAKFVDAAR